MSEGVNAPVEILNQDEKWNCKNLKFLTDFMEETGLTVATLAESIGLTRQSIYHWLQIDEVKISLIYKLFEANGYKITFDYVKGRSQEGINSYVDMAVEREPGEKNLSFLASALKRYKLRREPLSEKLGIGKTTIYYWLCHDEIFISYIFKIAEIAGLRVVIRITPIENK